MDKMPPLPEHDRALASAFDGQAAQFERAPVQTDPRALGRLVAFAELPPGSRILDAGCGPGLVAEAFLEAGHEVLGIDLSAEMVQRARRRCERFGNRARFRQGSAFEGFADFEGRFDAAVSRYVLHHVADPEGFVRRQKDLLKSGGTVVLCDHTTDPDPSRADWHQKVERLRDQTHTRNLAPGRLVDLFTGAGLEEVRLVEESFSLDFDEWFDRGSPSVSKAQVRALLEEAPGCRGFEVEVRDDGGLTMHCWRALVRGRRG